MRLRLLALIACAACGPTVVNEHKGVELTKHLPATLEASRPREGDPKTVKVRIYTDAGIRALPKWKEEISDQLDYANQLLTPLLGARLTVEKWLEWNRSVEPQKALGALAELDKGEGVTFVIGYVTAGDGAHKAMSELGQAEPLGRHVIIRGWAEKPETMLLSSRLPDLKDAARAEVFTAHRRHKQTVVLLHMLAAALGAIDESDPTWIQNPSYAYKQVTFSDRNRELMTLAIDERVKDTTDVELAKKLLESIEKNGFGGWIAASKEEVSKRLRIVIDSTKAGRTAGAIPTAAYDQFTRIQTLARQGKTADALVELDNLLIAYPGNAAMHHLRCEIALAISGPKPPAPKQKVPPKNPPKNPPRAPEPPAPQIDWKAACKKAGELAQGDPTPHMSVAAAYVRSNDLKSAREELVLAEGKIANLGSAGVDAWKKIVGIYTSLDALTWAEEAIAKGKVETEAKDAVAQIAQRRARYGMPKGGKFVTPDKEGQLLAAVRHALDLVYAAKYNEAEVALAAVERQWPGASGTQATRCDLHLRQGSVDGARAACARALAIDPGNSWAMYLSGVIALKTAAGTQQGIDWLKKAIAADGDLGQAWRTLAKAYARTKDKAAYEQLAKDYAAKFGSALPP